MSKVKLQPPALARLNELVEIVTKGKETFKQVGLALAEIKSRQLYLGWPNGDSNYETFEDFCEGLWGWSRQYAVKLLGAAVAVSQLGEEDAKKITSVKAAAALAKVPDAMKKAVVDAATKDGKAATAKSIKDATPKSATPPPKKKSGPPAKPAKSVPTLPKDRTGLEIPETIVPLWERGIEVVELLTYVSSVRLAIEKAQAFGDPKNPTQADPLFAEVNFSAAMASLDQASAELQRGKPFAVCPTCQGKLPGPCTQCKGRGFVSEFWWKTCVTQEARDIRDSIVLAQQENAND